MRLNSTFPGPARSDSRMEWLYQLSGAQPVAHAIGIVAFVCMAGMALGSVKLRGVGLGTAGVLFAGILVGHFTEPVSAGTLAFIKEFGLVLFVFAIGLQLGPGFFAALRQQGVRQNALAAAIVVLGAVCAPVIGWLSGFDMAAVLGVFSGASVNMPSLGAATQTLGTLPNITADRLALPALACAVTFPTAIVASLGTLLLLRKILRINVTHETTEYARLHHRYVEPPERWTLVVRNVAVDGRRIRAIPGWSEAGVTVARIRRADETRVAGEETEIRLGDRLAVVGTSQGLSRFRDVVGERTDEDLVLAPSPIVYRRVVVTEPAVLGKSVGELHLDWRFDVAITRMIRGDIEMTATPELRLRFGDVLHIVGHEGDLEKAAAALGNSVKNLNETHFIPLFIGIFLGVVVGTLPIALPGLPQPVRLGLAGGPLIVALLLGRFGRIGRLVCHMPLNANHAFRDLGIAFFFAGVGLDAGPKFFATVLSATGVQWMLAGACVTVFPLVAVGFFARVVCRMNFVDLSGLLAGSTTNPPALNFATSLVGSDAPTVAYATVYPLTMLLRILCAQVLALVLCR